MCVLAGTESGSSCGLVVILLGTAFCSGDPCCILVKCKLGVVSDESGGVE